MRIVQTVRCPGQQGRPDTYTNVVLCKDGVHRVAVEMPDYVFTVGEAGVFGDVFRESLRRAADKAMVLNAKPAVPS